MNMDYEGLLDHIANELGQLGYARNGSCFRKKTGEFLSIVEFQKSKDSIPGVVKFTYGGYAGDAVLILGGGGLGARSLVKRAGTEWSHWVPGRFIRRFTPKGRINSEYMGWLDNVVGRWFVNSRLNGNFVSRLEHRMSDLYRQMPGMKAATHPRWSRFRQQLNRIPQWIPGAGMLLSGASGAAGNSECGCE